MGKMKRRKLGGTRYTPLATKSSQSQCSESADGVVAEQIENGNMICDDATIKIKRTVEINLLRQKGGIKLVREKITSTICEEKLTGLNMLAAFALEENATEALVKNKIVGSVSSLLRDSNTQVRLAAAGALRNLCLGGSDEVVDLMVQQNIMPPLCQLLKEYSNNVPASASSKTPSLSFTKGIATVMEEKDEDNLIFIHATNLLWNLCECNEECVQLCNQEDLSQVLLHHIDPFVWSYSVSMAAADCLLCISENNPPVMSSILPQADRLVNLAFKSLWENDPAGLRFAVILSGILVNLNYWSPGGASFRQMFEVLNKALDVDQRSLTCHLIEKKISSDEIEYLITAQLLSLEILSNICCPEEEEQWEECEEERSDDDELDEDDLMDVGKLDGSLIPPEVIECIKYYDLVDKILKKISFSIEDLPRNERTEENIKKLRLLEIRSLQCYQNLVGILDLVDLGGANKLISTWFQLGKILFTTAGSDLVLLESSSGAMRAIIDKLNLEKCHSHINISEDDLKQLFEAGISCSESAVRANLSRMVGNIGCMLLESSSSKGHLSSNVLVSIADFLLQVSARDEELFVRAEALDTVIDLFSDDKTDVLASQIRLIKRLKAIQPEFKAKHCKNRKKLGDHRPLVVTVRDNLVAFIKYKGPRVARIAHSSSGSSMVL